MKKSYNINISNSNKKQRKVEEMQKEISQIQEALESTVNEYSKIVQFLNSFISTLRLDDAFHDYVIQQLATDPQPDGSVTVKDMECYGYQFHMHEKMLPLNHNRALELHYLSRYRLVKCSIYLLHKDGSKTLAHDETMLQAHYEVGGMFGIKNQDWQTIRPALPDDLAYAPTQYPREVVDKTMDDEFFRGAEQRLQKQGYNKERKAEKEKRKDFR